MGSGKKKAESLESAWSTTIVLEDTPPDEPKVVDQCPFFAVRLFFLAVTCVFFVLGVIMFVNCVVFENQPGFTSVAEVHNINTFLIATLLVAGPGFTLLLQVLYVMTRRRGRDQKSVYTGAGPSSSNATG